MMKNKKPFDALAEGLDAEDSRSGWTAIELFLTGIAMLVSQLSSVRRLFQCVSPIWDEESRTNAQWPAPGDRF